MKRFIGVLFVLAVVGAFTLAATHSNDYARVRPAGIYTHTGAGIYLVCDSSDTFQVDTFYSDTVLLDASTHWVNYVLTGHTHSLADSANDSVTVDVLIYTSYERSAKRLVVTDTFPTTLALGDTVWGFLNVDTLIFTRLWFETIISDSFISHYNVGAFSDKDSSEFRFTYEVLQK